MKPKHAKTAPIVALVVALGVVAAVPVAATGGPREVRGQILDREGNPVAGVVVIFTPADSANKQPVRVTSSKKGRFFVNLFSDRGDNFSIAVEAEGMLPVEVFLESRTVNRVLMGDPIVKTLKYGQSIPEIFIRPLGEGEVKITLAPEADLLAAAQAAAQAEAQAEAQQQGGGRAAQPARDPWDEALSLAADGDLEDAVPLFEEAIEKKPEDFERRETFAKVLYQLDRHDDAVEQAGKAVELAPQAVGPRMVIYSARVSQGDFVAAQAALDEAHGVAPENINVLEQMAYVAIQTDNQAAAISANERIVGVDPSKADTWAQLGDLYAKAGDLAKSEAAYEKVGELDPSGAHTVFYNIGALIMNRTTRTEAETQKAIAAFRKAIEVKSDYAEAHKQLAFALLGAGDRAAAKTALLAYVQHAPEAADVAQMKNLADAM